MKIIIIKLLRLGIYLLIITFITQLKQFQQFANAQSTPDGGVIIKRNIPQRVEETIPKPRETFPPPRIEPSKTPSLQLPSPSINIPLQPDSPRNELINIRKIEVLGNTVLQVEINQLLKKYINCQQKVCPTAFEEVVQLRSDITQLYIKNGYQTSGAFILNNQFTESGIVQIQVVEGELERIEIKGLSRLQEDYVRSRLQLATKAPLNLKRLEESLQLLQLDPLLQQVNARLIAGTTPGRSILQVNLKEAIAFNAGIVIDNYQSPSIGSLQGAVFVNHNNLSGFGDQFNAEYGLTRGLDIYNVSYKIPLNALDGTFNFRYNKNNSQIVSDLFADLGIQSNSETFSFALRQPLVKKPNTEVTLGLSLDIRSNQTFLFNDIPFSFSEEAEKGKSRVSVIRFSQDWLQRNPRQVIALRSQFSFGIGAFDATINNTGIDGRFFTWLGQFQWVQELSPNTLMIAKINTQLTPDALLSLEKIGVGGIDTVRGYRQNQLVADNGIIGSVEFRIPVTSNPNLLQIRPFFDIGTAWNNKDFNPNPQTIAGLGLGLNLQPIQNLFLSLDYGIPLIAAKKEGNSLQENGLYFSVRYQPF
ncbi:MAG: ShlB/FhaC/HecB family hemolysin secretion/activation protein [Scytonematopsis contorta HA4267-MV1]|jgi:hemolysin activation/secretion protein|nr:ShlB/FhaC/HecB family hemolysin secretion/activation protein [Scytonematopsis contorta HA4267-MV1]